jgi:hypothetical protein
LATLVPEIRYLLLKRFDAALGIVRGLRGHF